MPRLTPQPVRTMQDPVSVEPGAEGVPRTYVECMIGAERKPFGFFADRARARGWDTQTLNTGRDLPVRRPAVT
jgi:hypothetical protein